MKKRSMKFGGITLAFILFILTLAGCGAKKTVSSATSTPAATGNANASTSTPAAAEAKVQLPETLRIGFISANNTKDIASPEGWAKKNGLLEDELKKYGVKEFKYVNFPNGPNLNEALGGGSIDIGLYGDTPAINGKAAGLKTRIINQSAINNEVWLVAVNEGPKSLTDLKGKKIATAEGSYMHRYLLGLLKEQNLDKDVKVVHLLPPDGEAALLRGDIAAFAYPIGFGPQVLAKGKFTAIDTASKHPSLLGSSVTVVTEALLAKAPGFPKIWNDIRAKGITDATANKEAYYKFNAEVSGYTLDSFKQSYPIEKSPLEPLSKEGLALLEGTKTFLVEKGLSKKDFSINDWIAK